MKAITMIAWFVSASALAAAQEGTKKNASARPLSAADETAIRAASKRYEQAGNARDWPAMLALFTEDIVFMPPHAPEKIGRKAAEEMLKTYPSFKHLRLEPLEFDGAGAMAWVRGRYSYVLTPPNQPEQPDTGKYIEIWRKQADGAWKYARGIFNSDLPLAVAGPDAVGSAGGARVAVEQGHEKFIAAMRADDVNAIVALLAPDVVFSPPNSERLLGPNAVRAWYRAIVERMKTTGVTISDRTVTLAGDHAIEEGSFVWNLAPKGGGAPVQDRGKFVAIWKRQSDGAWKVTHDIWNSSLPLPGRD